MPWTTLETFNQARGSFRTSSFTANAGQYISVRLGQLILGAVSPWGVLYVAYALPAIASNPVNSEGRLLYTPVEGFLVPTGFGNGCPISIYVQKTCPVAVASITLARWTP